MSERRPIVGVGAFVFDSEDRLLLIRRGKPPLVGTWVVPGGTLEWGETIDDGTKREVLEETGLEIEIEGRLDVIEAISAPVPATEFHFIIVDSVARVIGGSLRAGSDATDAAWVLNHDFKQYAVPRNVADLYETARAIHAQHAPRTKK